MTKYFIDSLDKKVTKGENVGLDKAMLLVEQYIVKNIDPTFPVDKFRDWLDSDSELPFRHNKNLYYWNEQDLKGVS
jgi:hypothetical protein